MPAIFIMFCGGIWTFILLILGVAAMYNVSTGTAVGILIVNCIAQSIFLYSQQIALLIAFPIIVASGGL